MQREWRKETPNGERNMVSLWVGSQKTLNLIKPKIKNKTNGTLNEPASRCLGRVGKPSFSQNYIGRSLSKYPPKLIFRTMTRLLCFKLSKYFLYPHLVVNVIA